MQIRNDERVILLEGKVVATILPRVISLLDGSLTVEEIIKRLQNVDKGTIYDILYELNNFRLLTDGSIEPPVEVSSEELKLYDLQLNLFSHFYLNKYEPQLILNRSKVAVINIGALGSRISELLCSSGIGGIIGIDYNEVTQTDMVTNGAFSESNIGELRANVVKKICSRIACNNRKKGTSAKYG